MQVFRSVHEIIIVSTMSPFFIALLALVASTLRTRSSQQAEIVSPAIISPSFNKAEMLHPQVVLHAARVISARSDNGQQNLSHNCLRDESLKPQKYGFTWILRNAGSEALRTR
jgi:hypothetical protein